MATEEFLSQLAKNPDSVHKAPVNRYQHFINAKVYLKCKLLKRADAVKQAQDDWRERTSKSEEEYEATMKLAQEKMKKSKTRPIQSFFKVQV